MNYLRMTIRLAPCAFTTFLLLGQSNETNETSAQARRQEVALGCMADDKIGSIVMQARAAGQSQEADRILNGCVNARLMIESTQRACRENAYVAGLLRASSKSEEKGIVDDCVQATYRCQMNKGVSAQAREARTSGRLTQSKAIMDECITAETKKRRD